MTLVKGIIHGGSSTAHLMFALGRELVLMHGLHKALWRAIRTNPRVPPIFGGLYYARVDCFQDLWELIGSVVGWKYSAP